MGLKHFYKCIVPNKVRNYIAGCSWGHRLYDWQMMREGRQLAAQHKKAQKSADKIRVAFLVQRTALWANHASIYEAMASDPAFEVSVIAIPKRPPESKEYDWAEFERLKIFLSGKAIHFFEGFDIIGQKWVNPLKFGLPDIVFMPQPYMQTQPALYGSSFWRHFAKIGYVPYGILLADLPQLQYQLSFYRDCWRIFVESQAHRDLFCQHNPAICDQMVVTGHPKTDTYLQPARTAGLWKLPRARKRIIWAPHFTVAKGRSAHTFSNFFQYYDFFLEYARVSPDIEFVLRPHPELFAFLVSTGLKTREEASAYRDRFNALPNGQVYEGGDIFEMFKESDALILDSIGFLAEYLPTCTPICFLDSDRRQRLNNIGEALLAVYYKAWNTEDIDRFIREVVVAGVDPMKEKRQARLETSLFLPTAGAGFAIKEYIRKSGIVREGKGP